MLLGRAFAYSDTHRHRIGPNYLQLPVNRPRVEVNTYTQDGAMAYEHRGDDPVYAPNSFGRGYADEVGEVDDELGVRRRDGAQAYTLRAGRRRLRPGRARWSARSGTTSSVRRSCKTVAGHMLGGVEGDVLERAFEYWKNVDAECGKRIEELVRQDADLGAPGAQPGRRRAAASDPIVEPDTHADT